MGQRRGLLIVVVAVVGLVILVCSRCGAADDDAPPDDPSRPSMTDQQARPGPVPPPAGTLAPDLPPAPHDRSDATVEESLAPQDEAEALAVAAEFAEVWAGSGADRAEELARLATSSLAAELIDASPPEPAPTALNEPMVEVGRPEWASVAIDTDQGKLVLYLHLGDDGQWQVAGMDWQPR